MYGHMPHNRSLRRHSNEDFIVIISCCYVSRSPCDMLCADPLSAMELSSLMNLSRVSDSGWGNVVYKTGRRLCGCIWTSAKCRAYYWWVCVKGIKAPLLPSDTPACYALLGELLYLLDSSHSFSHMPLNVHLI